MASTNILPNRIVTQDERRSRALAALILHSGATELDQLDLSNPLIASSSIANLREQLDIATRAKGVPLSNAFRRILSSKPVLRLGSGQEWEKVDDVRWKNIQYKLMAYRLSGLFYSEVDVFQVNFVKDIHLPREPLQYHIASLVTKSSLGYFASRRSTTRSLPLEDWSVDKLLDLDPEEFPPVRNHTGSMNRGRETLRTWPKRKPLTGDELTLHNTIITKILYDY